MASSAFKGMIGAFVAGSLMFSATAASAANAVPARQVNPWAVLTAMSGGAPAAAMCGAAAAAAAAQTPTGCVLPAMDAPPPPPAAEPAPLAPVPPPAAGMGISPIILGLLAVAAGVGIYLAIHHHGDGNSPA